MREIYKIISLVDGKIYIGSTTQTFKIRFKSHINALKNEKHGNIHLQNAFNKYGEENFKFEIIEECVSEKCIEREQYWLDTIKSYDLEIGYNMCPKAGRNTTGKIIMQSQRDNISKSLKGLSAGEKHPLWGTKREPTTLGYKHSEESKEKMRVFQRNRIKSEKEITKWKEMLKTQKGEQHPSYGKKITGERLIKLQNLRKGLPCPNRRVIIKVDMDKNEIARYESLTYAAKENKITLSSMSALCNRIKKPFQGKYFFIYG